MSGILSNYVTNPNNIANGTYIAGTFTFTNNNNGVGGNLSISRINISSGNVTYITISAANTSNNYAAGDTLTISITPSGGGSPTTLGAYTIDSTDLTGVLKTGNLRGHMPPSNHIGDGTYTSNISTRLVTTREFEVTVGSKTAAHPYQGGSSNAYFIAILGRSGSGSSQEAPLLNFVVGQTYTFIFTDTNTLTNHPLRFYLDVDKTTQYTTGVTTTNTSVSIQITSSTPTTLYYQCSNHIYMGNVIRVSGVIGSGASVSQVVVSTTGKIRPTDSQGNFFLSGTMPTNPNNIADGTYTSSLTLQPKSSSSTAFGGVISQINIDSAFTPPVLSIFMRGGAGQFSGEGYNVGDVIIISINGTALGDYTLVSDDLTSDTNGGIKPGNLRGTMPSNPNNIVTGTYFLNIAVDASDGYGIGIGSLVISSGNVSSIRPSSSGNGLTAGDTLTIVIGGVPLGTYTLIDTDIGTDVTSITMSSGGSDYAENDKLIVSINGTDMGQYFIDSTDLTGVFRTGNLRGAMPKNLNNIADGIHGSNLSVTSDSANGSGASINTVYVSSSGAIVTMNTGGSSYVPGDNLTVSIDNVALGTYKLYGTLNGTFDNIILIKHGPFQVNRTFTSKVVVSDKTIKYNSSTSNYESNHLSLILPTNLSWLSTTLNVSDTITENSAISGLSNNDISGNVTDGFYFTTSTAPATDTTPYYWVFDVIGKATEADVQTHSVKITISDNDQSTPPSFDFNIKFEIQSFSYFIPDNITRPVQGSVF